MQNKIMFKNEDSCIAIKDDKMYILSTRYKDISSRALTVMSGFQIELGRDINDIITALKETRVPVIIKEVISNGDKSHYQIIRMHTGKVDDKLVATLLCNNGIIHSISFNRALIRDGSYRQYNILSVLHQLSVPYNLCDSTSVSRSEQLKQILKSVMNIVNNIEVTEKDNQLVAITNEDNLKLSFKFILNKNNNNRYELISISLAQ
ncbi:MAG: hypothetical protein J6A59_01205 [Lachnospiraceae bacterium]|nr:hypothetical protein [Lachnospiraceae bacterium]